MAHNEFASMEKDVEAVACSAEEAAARLETSVVSAECRTVAAARAAEKQIIELEAEAHAALKKFTMSMTCLEQDHRRSLESKLTHEEAMEFESDDFFARCHEVFRKADVDGSGFLEAGAEDAAMACAVTEALGEEFLDRIHVLRAEHMALSFDDNWDGRLSPDEFLHFVKWARMMKLRGFLEGQAPFETIGTGQGERLMLVSEFMDEDATLRAALRTDVDLAVYHPVGITCTEFATQLQSALARRKKLGLPGYKTVALANHGPGPEGVWEIFAGPRRDLTDEAHVAVLLPAFAALASLLPDDKDARLDLLCCDLAGVPGGLDLVRRVEHETGRRVCASKDKTGNVAHGGNWALEVGNVNVAEDYFDQCRLEHFAILMGRHLTVDSHNKVRTLPKNNSGEDKRKKKRVVTTESSSSDSE